MLSALRRRRTWSNERNVVVMGTWWRFRQWIYARPRIAAGVVAVVLSVIGFSGWASARIVTHGDATQSQVVLQRRTVVRTIRVGHAPAGRAVRTLTAPPRARTVVVTQRVTRFVPSVQMRTRLIATPSTAVETITEVRRQTVPGGRTVTRIVTATVTHTATQTQPAETIVRTVTTPPGHATTGRETRTVTVTVTVATATVTVTVPKGR
jgi:hypothetical protein